jgi:hypothetical protein
MQVSIYSPRCRQCEGVIAIILICAECAGCVRVHTANDFMLATPAIIDIISLDVRASWVRLLHHYLGQSQ